MHTQVSTRKQLREREYKQTIQEENDQYLVGKM